MLVQKEKSPREKDPPNGLRADFLPGLRNSPRQRPVTGLKQSSATAAAKSPCSFRLKGPPNSKTETASFAFGFRLMPMPLKTPLRRYEHDVLAAAAWPVVPPIGP